MKTVYLKFLAMALLAVNIAAFAADEIHWTVTGKDSVTFNWRGTSAENSIGYGLSSGNYTQVMATKPNPNPVSSSGPFWEAKLTGLHENMRYYYKIGNKPERSFHTGPALGSSDFNVYVQGNIGSTSTYFNMGGVQDIIAGDMPAFVVGLGDLTLGNIDGRAAVDQHFNDVMAWSTQSAYMPVWGERDAIKTGIKDNFKNYKGRFAVPNSQTSPGSPLTGGEDWYWFDYGNVRFITLPEPWTGAWNDWMTKAGTLMSQAQGDPNINFIVTFVHRPAYSSGHVSGFPALKTNLDKLGDTYSKYQLNVNAHSNNYERSFPQHGVTHVTAGTGGADLTQDGDCLWLTCAKPDWSAFRAMHLGALKLHFTLSGIEGSFICGPAGGGINDVNCQPGHVLDSFVIGELPISGVSAYDITKNEAKITWKVNEPSTGQVEYGTTTLYGQTSVKETSFNYSSHIQQLSGLAPDTQYHFRVRSANQAGVESVSGDYTFSTTTPLTINISQANVKCNGALTGSATVSVLGGKSPYTYLWSGGGTSAIKDNLAAGTYSVTVTDANGSTKTDSVTITEPAAMAVSMSQVNVSSFGGSNGSATVVATGGVSPYSYLWSNGGTSAIKNSLPAGTYTVAVTDANSCAKTGSVTITQPAEPVGPIISGASAININQTDAQITWTLNEGSTGQVEYGTTTAYGQMSVKEPSFIYLTHVQSLSNLTPGTLYHYRIRSTNQAGVESVSRDYIFTTAGVIITGPTISAVSAINVNQTDAQITWTLSEGSTGQVEYGTTTAYGQMSVKEPSFIYLSHEQKLSNLTPGTPYHFRVRSTNQAGVESVSGDYTFTTIGNTVLPIITGPTISAVSAANLTQNDTNITWTLSEPATGQVEYGTTTSYGQMSTKESSFLYTSHTQKISGLTPGTLYHYRVRSANQAGAESVSGDFTFTAAGGTATSVGTIPLITDKLSTFTEPTVSRPGYLSSITDSTFRTKVTRIGGDTGINFSFSQGGTGTWAPYCRHKYAKAQAWNADQSLIAIIQNGYYVYLDGANYTPKFQFPMHADDRWHNVLPNTRISAHASLLEWFDATTNVQTRSWTLPFPVIGIGMDEGNTSQDSRYVALADATRVFVVDMDPQAPLASYASGNRRIGPVRDVSDGGAIDWVSVSPSGKYLVIQYAGPNTRVFDINPTTLAITPRIEPAGSNTCSAKDPTQGYILHVGHADMTLNPFDNNEDYIIGQAQAGCPAVAGAVVKIRLKDNQATGVLTPQSSATMSHISARNIQRPGWVYVTFYDPANYQWDAAGLRFDDELVAVKIDGTGSVERLAHAHTFSLNSYNAQAQAAASPDGLRVLWASNWQLKGNGPSYNDIKPYVVDTRQ